MKLFKKPLKPELIGFLQAAGVVAYISLVATIMNNGSQVFGALDNSFFGPVVFLTLFAVSILICGFITLGYPVRLFWIEKKPAEAIKIVWYMTAFLALSLLVVFATLIITQ